MSAESVSAERAQALVHEALRRGRELAMSEIAAGLMRCPEDREQHGLSELTAEGLEGWLWYYQGLGDEGDPKASTTPGDLDAPVHAVLEALTDLADKHGGEALVTGAAVALGRVADGLAPEDRDAFVGRVLRLVTCAGHWQDGQDDGGT